MATLRFGDVLKSYSSKAESGDFKKWMTRVKAIAKIQKVEDLCSFLPLFITGEAFDVYQELSEETKQDSELIEEALENAFCPNQFQAYEELRDRTWKEGESVDAYLADIKRLVSLAGCGKSESNEKFIKSAFMWGLPSLVRVQLLAMADAVSMPLSELVLRARTALPVISKESSGLVAAAGRPSAWSSKGRPTSRELSSAQGRGPFKCFKCNELGHKAVNCPRFGTSTRCFKCQGFGHVSRVCPSTVSSTPGNLNCAGELSAVQEAFPI